MSRGIVCATVGLRGGLGRAVLCGLAAAVLLAGAAGAKAVTVIDFSADAVGAKPNGWSSVQSPQVAFSDSMGANLQVDDYGSQSHGKALACYGDDPSYLIMDFSSPMNWLQLEFGNDDPGWANPGDQAVLTAFLQGVQVAQTKVTMNRDDIMNQSISVSGVQFDKATFFYDVTLAAGLIEIVDNVSFDGAAVPEPVTMASLFFAIGGLGAYIRRRRLA